jgi:ATP adenylyltransferase/5',5'''-P-1,P-4-tetraphosphate phosphorylase II
MYKDKLINNKNSHTETLSSQIKSLLDSQIVDWELAKNNYKGLESVKVKEFSFDGFSIKVQFNPSRIISTSAKVDAKSIQERKCFLCKENLPKDQRGIEYKNEYIILVNPFPIFPEHFTIPKVDHKPQRIKENFEDILDLSKDLQDRYAVFYNGPKCGASAPDHMHFQAGIKNFMPVDYEFESIQKINLSNYGKVKISYTESYLRNFISLESSDKLEIINAFKKVYDSIELVEAKDDEPMMNVVASYQNDEWRVIVFPREKHRPSHYFEEGEKQVLLSPASVDLGGVCITPREDDFNKITKTDIKDILTQVGVGKEKFDRIISCINI